MSEEFLPKQPSNPTAPPESAPVLPPPMPKFIGPYKIETLLEKGGMSLLYLGTHPDTKEPVTVKVLSPRFLTNTEVVKRFLKEAEIIAMANHPNIVKLYGYGEWEAGLYIAMEFIQGISLRQYLLQTPASLTKSLEIILDISYAICHLHTHGVIHRDLKPENILMTESGTIKLIDFGISQLLTERKNETSSKGRFIGTPIYMSPEQKENPETVSYPSDIYSLGIIAYELILGKLSHGQIHLSLMPKGIQKILGKTLQYKPEERYHDIVDFISDINAYLQSATLQNDKKPADRISELSENLQQAFEILLPSQAPRWPLYSIGLITHKSFMREGLYYDFLTVHDDAYGLILAESIAGGAEGILQIASFRGMLKALHYQAEVPAELIKSLNDILTRNQAINSIALNYLILFPKEKKFRFISCQSNPLIKYSIIDKQIQLIDTENVMLGVDSHSHFSDTTQSFSDDNILFLTSFSPPYPRTSEENEMIKNIINATLIEYNQEAPQKIVELVQRKIRLSPFLQIKERSFILICIRNAIL